MSKIRLHGTSSGYTEIAPVAASGNNTLTLPNDGTIISKDAAGAVGVTSIKSSNVNVGAAVTITESGIEASGIGITCANINGGQLSGRRNLVINGAMNIAQRATTYTGTNNYHTVDRILTSNGGLDENCTMAQVDVSAGTTPYTLGFRKAFKVTNGNQTSGAGSGDYVQIQTRLEAQDIANSGWNYTSTSSFVTLQFWVKSSVAQNFYCYIRCKDGTAQMYPFETGSLSADTWTKVVKTIPGNSNLTFDNNNGEGFQINISPFWGTDYTGSVSLNAWGAYSSSTRTPDYTSTWYTTNDATFEITGLQLEVGSQATAFEHLSKAEELTLCERYCEVILEGEGDGAYMVNSVGYATNQLYGIFRFKVEKRVSPTLEHTTGTNYYINYRDNSGVNFDGFSGLSWPNKRATGVYTTSSVTSGHAGLIGSSNSGAKLYVTAEL